MRRNKVNPMRHMLPLAICSMMMASVFSGCQEDVYDPNAVAEQEETANTFDFSTTTTVQLNVQYDVPEGYQVLFDVYLEYPFITDEDGQTVLNPNLEPAIRRMTDANGKYSGTEVIEADHGTEAYIYTSYIGVPGLYKTSISGNAITADVSWESAAASTRYQATWDPTTLGLTTLGTWTSTGYPNYLDEETSITLTSAVLETINSVWGVDNKDCPEEYLQDADFTLSKDAELAVRFIGGSSSAASTFGYYCYKEESDIANAVKCVVFPNTLTTSRSGKAASGLQGGESVRLLYFDENGNSSTTFPAGTKIGWFLMNECFNYGKSGGTFYSTKSQNSDGRTHTAAYAINSNFVVLSFEDWNDSDYNDVIFNVWANPMESITGELPEPEGGDDNEVFYTSTYHGILAFEDQWPKKGDYDMNDVIVKYNSVLSFNSSNEVLSATDTYTLLWSGATYRNGFSYQLNAEKNNVTTEVTSATTTFEGQGLDAELSTATINVLTDAIGVTQENTVTNATYVITNTFTTPINHETFGVPPYNPFITVGSSLSSGRNEVHLVNYAPTAKMDESLFKTGDDLSDTTAGTYYVASGNYPFAIHLSSVDSFNVPEETKPISETYPNFINWVKSSGASYTDWYKTE
ncbi:MAG: LruC domain-containing protein [Bacteroides sp.]|nr:LruC domain-containing protein [Bacteroides sp.]